MNTFPGPENSWEGVDAYFTYANSEGALIFWTLFVIALCVLVTMQQQDTSLILQKKQNNV